MTAERLSLVDVLERELRRTQSLRLPTYHQWAQELAGPVADWMAEAFVHWATEGLEMRQG